MDQRSYIILSGSIFGLIAVLHVLRLLSQWQVTIAGMTVPLWLSGMAAIVAGAMALAAFQIVRR